MNHATTSSNLALNPQCKIDVSTLSNLNDTPFVQVNFKDGKFMEFKAHETTGDEIVQTVNKYCRKLSQEEDTSKDNSNNNNEFIVYSSLLVW